MKEYKREITLNKNARGCYILDTVKGCSSCIKIDKKGCYGECYAKNIADRYGFDFSKSIDRDFYYDKNQIFMFGMKDENHIFKIISQIKSIKMPFIRIGEMGDPSENWEHTIDICKEISIAKKTIVIVTKHWKTISKKMLKQIESMDICINTSISALDSYEQIKHRLSQFNILKKHCRSVLRIVSCDFNIKNKEGKVRANIQKKLFNQSPNIDTIFRCSKKNDLVKKGIINIEKIKFLKSYVLVSRLNKYTYFGDCQGCPDMCGIAISRRRNERA